MLQLNEQECWQMSTGLTRIMTASVEDFRHIVFEVLSEIAPFDCGVSYVVKNNPNQKDCLEPLAHPQAKFVPTVTEIFRAAELAHKSSAYTSMEWQNKSFIFRDSDMFSEEFLSNTEIGRMIHDEWGMSYACKIFLVHNDLLLGKFWLLRQEESGNFQEKELFRLRLLEPLVTRKMYEFHPQNDKGRYAKKVLTKLYKPFLINNFRVIFMDIPSAEMTKYAANSMLATRISFMNDIANLCERVGADVNMVRAGIGSDTRIGRKFLYAGCGYGGSCFPKDVKALIKTADQNGYSMEVLKAVERVNEKQKSVLYEKLVKAFGSEEALKGKTIAMWGLSFKPETDDMRESTALVMIGKLLDAGCQVRAYDPIAMNECKRRIGDKVTYCRDMYDCVLDADALLLLTEWKEFRLPGWGVIGKAMKQKLVIDGRNIFDTEELDENGFEYHCIGK